MIVTRIEILNGRTFIVTTSDSGYMIERDGYKYSEAWDLDGSGRTYTETDERIKEASLSETEEKAEAFDILMGCANDIHRAGAETAAAD